MNEYTQTGRMGQGSLKGKVALLYDGAHTNGRSLAISLAERGADVVIVYHKADVGRIQRIKERVEAEGQRCVIILSRPNDAQFSKKTVSETIARLGRLDIFIDYSASSRVSRHKAASAGRSEKMEWLSDNGLSWPMVNVEILATAMTQMLDPQRTDG